MKTISILAIILLLLAACGSPESDAKKSVLGSLKDPDSAKFGQFTKVGERFACLTVNARNSMGGYTGNQEATLVQKDNIWVVMDIEKWSHDMCIEVMERISEKTKSRLQGTANQ